MKAYRQIGRNDCKDCILSERKVLIVNMDMRDVIDPAQTVCSKVLWLLRDPASFFFLVEDISNDDTGEKA